MFVNVASLCSLNSFISKHHKVWAKKEMYPNKINFIFKKKPKRTPQHLKLPSSKARPIYCSHQCMKVLYNVGVVIFKTSLLIWWERNILLFLAVTFKFQVGSKLVNISLHICISSHVIQLFSSLSVYLSLFTDHGARGDKSTKQNRQPKKKPQQK